MNRLNMKVDMLESRNNRLQEEMKMLREKHRQELSAEVEARLGHPVWTHQFGDKDFAENTIKPLFEEDFLKIVHGSKNKENKMSDGITDSSRDSEAHKKLGGSAYCNKCGKYHPILPFCSKRKSAKIVLQDAMMDLNRSIKEIEQERVAITLMYDSIDWNNLTVLEEESLYYFLTNKLTLTG